MTNLQSLLEQLTDYQTDFPEEQKSQEKMVAFLRNETEGGHFSRQNQAGHMVAGAWLVDPDDQAVLLTYHGIHDRWLQLGGHADGQTNLLQVARREAGEESGIGERRNIVPISGGIFDVDVHFIPNNPARNEPEHWHYEVRYLLQARTRQIKKSAESKDLRWWSREEMQEREWERSMARMLEKWQRQDKGATGETSSKKENKIGGE